MIALAAFMLACNYDADTISVMDRFRFPFTAQQTEFYWRFASGHTTWARAHADPAWIADAEWRRAAWDKLDNCIRCYKGNDRLIRQELATLRSMIGPEAFWRGIMPCPVPEYRFRDR